VLFLYYYYDDTIEEGGGIIIKKIVRRHLLDDNDPIKSTCKLCEIMKMNERCIDNILFREGGKRYFANP
jgi:hypothetical protein